LASFLITFSSFKASQNGTKREDDASSRGKSAFRTPLLMVSAKEISQLSLNREKFTPQNRTFTGKQHGEIPTRPRVLAELRDLARRHTPDSIIELDRLAKKAKRLALPLSENYLIAATARPRNLLLVKTTCRPSSTTSRSVSCGPMVKWWTTLMN
jgi:hypothetical protein